MILFKLNNLSIFIFRPNSFLLELIRCLLFIIVDIYYGSLIKELLYNSDTAYKMYKWFIIISFNIMLLLMVNDLMQSKTNLNEKNSSTKIKNSSDLKLKNKSN